MFSLLGLAIIIIVSLIYFAFLYFNLNINKYKKRLTKLIFRSNIKINTLITIYMRRDNLNEVDLFKALGDETRLNILDMLSCGELCACELTEGLNLSQPTISHHMKILQGVELVIGRKNGKWMHYSINKRTKRRAVR